MLWAIWNMLEMLWIGLISVALLIRARLRESVARWDEIRSAAEAGGIATKRDLAASEGQHHLGSRWCGLGSQQRIGVVRWVKHPRRRRRQSPGGHTAEQLRERLAIAVPM